MNRHLLMVCVTAMLVLSVGCADIGTSSYEIPMTEDIGIVKSVQMLQGNFSEHAKTVIVCERITITVHGVAPVAVGEPARAMYTRFNGARYYQKVYIGSSVYCVAH